MPYRLRIDRLRAAALAAGDQSNIAMARRTGISESALSRMLRGQARPRLETLLQIGQSYGLTQDDLVETTEAAA
ncbi:helix-turn-helix domain-containing protein [Streptomyces sp. NPDC096136]|uniref:helix-turn-helix domain-containing protein n=1 Tax=Streptomyces sp. NPDC096136 TaxID=3366076 RepID=UPI003813CE0E